MTEPSPHGAGETPLAPEQAQAALAALSEEWLGETQKPVFAHSLCDSDRCECGLSTSVRILAESVLHRENISRLRGVVRHLSRSLRTRAPHNPDVFETAQLAQQP